MLEKNEKIWEVLGAWQNIEPRPGYVERFKERIAQHKTWQEIFLEKLKTQFNFRQPAFQTVLALGAVAIIFVSGQSYSNYVTTKSLLSNMNEQQWEMLANFETVSKMDLVKEM